MWNVRESAGTSFGWRFGRARCGVGLVLLGALIVPGISAALELRFNPASYQPDESDPDLQVGVELALDSPDECTGIVQFNESAFVIRSRETSPPSASGGAVPATGIDFLLVQEIVPLGVTASADTFPVMIDRVLGDLIQDDDLADSGEQFELQLQILASGLNIQCIDDDTVANLPISTGSPATVTILDDDEPPTIDVADAEPRAEGDTGTTTFSFEVTISEPPLNAVTVSFGTSDGTATAGSDYLAVTDSLTFDPGDGAPKTITVEVVGDLDFEADETFSVELTAATGAAIGNGTGTGTILNDDSLPSGIAITDVSMAEGDSGTTDFAFTVTLSPASALAVTVDYSTRDGSATVAGGDYTAAAGTLTLMPGETARTVTVVVDGDERVESDERFFVDLSGATNGTIADSEGVGTIRNDDDDADEPATTPSGLEIVEGDGQSGKVNEALAPLVVEVTDAGADVTVEWRIAEGDAAFAGGGQEAETITDAQGLAEVTVILGETPGEVRVTAAVAGIEDPATFNLTAELLTQNELESLDPVAAPVAEALNEICLRGDLTAELAAICRDLGALSPDQQNAALRAIAHEEVSAQVTVALQGPKAQIQNIGSRLAAIRTEAPPAAGAPAPAPGTGPSVSTAGLSFRLGDVSLSGRSFAGFAGHRRLEELDIVKMFNVQVGGGGGSDAKEPEAPATAGSRLGFFVNGSAGFGKRPATTLETGLDFETQGLTAGIDYRLRDDLVVGGALGYLSNGVDLNQSSGELDSEGYSLSFYGTYYKERFYLDAMASYVSSDLDVDRVVDFPGRPRAVARGETDSDQVALSIGLGYNLQQGKVTLGGFSRIDFLDGDIDGYHERGAPGYNLAIDSQEIKSLLANLGFQVAYARGFTWGILSPTVRIALAHELEDGGRLIEARLLDDPSGTGFALATADPDRDYLNLGLGFSAVIKGGNSGFIFYEQDLDRDDLDFYMVTGGLRFEF